jgi:hypothetical protein
MKGQSKAMSGAVAMCMAAGASAQVDLAATNRGSLKHSQSIGVYEARGGAPDGVYDAGGGPSGFVGIVEMRNWFVFDLSSVTAPITSAELRLDAMTILNGNAPFITYQTTSTTTSASTLISPPPASQLGPIFDSLGTGDVFSSLDVTNALSDTTLVFGLNAAGVALINANLGGTVAFTGRVTTFPAATTPEVMFKPLFFVTGLTILRLESGGCYADCDTSTGAGTLDIFDFLCFQNSFVAGEPYACDCDTSTGPGVCDIFDFLCFQNAFVAGCP